MRKRFLRKLVIMGALAVMLCSVNVLGAAGQDTTEATTEVIVTTTEGTSTEVTVTGVTPEEEVVSEEAETSLNGVSGDVLINETNIPDAAFREFLMSPDRFGGIFSDGVATAEELSKFSYTSMDIRNTEIKSLEGVELLFNPVNTPLETLDICLCDPDFDMSTIPSYIKNLHIGKGIKPENIDISQFTDLKWLTMEYIDLPDDFLNMSTFTELEKLSLYRVEITGLDVSKCTKLKELSLTYMPLTTVDVSNNTQLTELILHDTDLTDIDISNCTELVYLDIGDTDIDLSKVDLSNNKKLKKLATEWTPLLSYEGCNFAPETIEGMDSLWVGCVGFDLESLYRFKNVEYLEIHNGGDKFDVSNLPNLKSLHIFFGSFFTDDYVFGKNESLERLYISVDKLDSMDVSQLTNLEYIRMDIGNMSHDLNKISTIDFTGNTKLKEVDCMATCFVSMNLSQGQVLDRLYVPYKDDIDDWNNYITVEGDTLDMKTLDPNFDYKKVKNLRGATYKDGVFLLTQGENKKCEIYYDYDVDGVNSLPVHITVYMKGETTTEAPTTEATTEVPTTEATTQASTTETATTTTEAATTETANTDNAVATGDEANPATMAGVMIFAMAGVLIIVGKLKCEKK